jgi:hypothetical protein
VKWFHYRLGVGSVSCGDSFASKILKKGLILCTQSGRIKP